MSLREAAAHARVSTVTLRREAKNGRLRAYKVGGRRLWRFKQQEVDQWLQNMEAPSCAK